MGHIRPSRPGPLSRGVGVPAVPGRPGRRTRAATGSAAPTGRTGVRSPLFVGIVLSATALGLVAPILKDAGESECEFGQLVLAAATIADLGTVILLSLLFSGNAGSVGSRLALLGSF